MARLPTEDVQLGSPIRYPGSSVSAAEIAGPFNLLAQGLDAAGETFQKAEIEQASYDGMGAVGRGPQGELSVDLRKGYGPSATAYNRARLTAYQAAQLTESRVAAQKGRVESGEDPEKFQEYWKTYSEKAVDLAREHNPILAGPTSQILAREGADVYNSILQNNYQNDLKRDTNQIKGTLDLLNQDMATLAHDGGVTTPAYQKRLDDTKALVNEMVHNPALSFSQADADAYLRGVEHQHMTEAQVGMVERAYQSGGLTASRKLTETIFNDPKVDMTPEEKRQFMSLANGVTSNLDGGRRAELSAARGEYQTALQGFALTGRPMPDEDFNDLSTRLAELGGHKEWQQLAWQQSTAKAMQGFGQLTPQQQEIAARTGRLPGGAFIQPIVTAQGAGRVSAGSIEGVNPDLIERFRAVQDAFGRSIPIISGMRDPDTNRQAGGAVNSQHLRGNAIDLDVSNLSKEERIQLIKEASANGITGIGVYENSIHFDVGNKRAWGPTHHRDSVPDWAEAAIGEHLQSGAGYQGVAGGGSMTVLQAMEQVESSGDPNAVSGKGARGLMQVMPGTAKEIAQELGDQNFPTTGEADIAKYLSDPQVSRRYGAHYFNKMLVKYGGDMEAALVAYNGGSGVADAWLKAGRPPNAYVQKVREAMGGSSGAYNPVLEKAMQEQYKQTVRDQKAIQDQFTQIVRDQMAPLEQGMSKGFAPAQDQIDFLANAVPSITDPRLQQQVSDFISMGDLAQAAQGATPGQLEGAKEKADAVAAAGATPANLAMRDYFTSVSDATKAGLASDPYGTAVARGRAPPSEPIDMTNASTFNEGMAKRLTGVRMAEQWAGTGPISPFTPEESRRLAGVWAGGSPDQKLQFAAQLVGSMDQEHFAATMEKIAASGERDVAFVGGLYAEDPNVARGVVYGEALLATKRNLAPDAGNVTAWQDPLSEKLPANTVAPGLNSYLADASKAVRSYYAYKSSQASDETGILDDSRLATAVHAVTGGVLDMNNRKVIAPERGMTQDVFDNVLAGLTDADLAGAVTPTGTPVTADWLRGSGHLQAVSDGQYLITSTYSDSQQVLRSKDMGPFVLDLRDRKAVIVPHAAQPALLPQPYSP